MGLEGSILGGNGITLLSQATGYGMVIGFSILFAILILAAVRIQKLYLQEDSGKSEMFMVANRSVGTGLTASAVFSSWVWINETVFSCVVCYTYGIAAPMWFATGVSFQVALMGTFGVLTKLGVPYAHTSLEFIRQRYGPDGHAVFTLLNLINNVFNGAAMILTGAQLIVGITGIHLAAATILLPIGVVLYTAVGGLKATFLTDFVHTTILVTLLIWFTIGTLSSEHIGGLSGLYDKVLAAESNGTIERNYLGSLLTFKSKGAVIWSLILKYGNLALITMDTAFWQKSFASEVHSTVPGYDLAALAIFSVPWAIGTVIGLTARAIETLPIFPTYPEPFTAAEVGAGYVMPYVLYAILGSGGAVGMLFCLFMAVTSTVSSSMIAVSSILSFDIYLTYLNPKATDKQVVRAAHLGVVFHGVFITGISLALSYGGANMSWLNYCSPVLTSPGVFPLLLTLMWSGQTRTAAVLSPLLGLGTGISIWLATAYTLYGEITILTTAMESPAIYGCTASLFSPILYSVVISYIKPEKFDWREFLRTDHLVEDVDSSDDTGDNTSPNLSTAVLEGTDEKGRDPIVAVGHSLAAANEKSPAVTVKSKASRSKQSLDDVVHPFDEETLRYLRKWYKISWAFLIVLFFVTSFVWPFALYRNYVFTKSFFRGWVTVAIIWQFFAFFAVIVFPVWDGRRDLSLSVNGLWNSMKTWRAKSS